MEMRQFFAGTPAAAIMSGAESLEAGQWVPALLDLGAGSADLLRDLDSKPGESAFGWGIGIAIENLPPLTGWMNELGGAPRSVRATAAALSTAGQALMEGTPVSPSPSQVWAGEAAVAHSEARAVAARDVWALGGLLKGASTSLEMVAVVVETVRTMIRDAIAKVLAKAACKLAISSVVPVAGQAVAAVDTAREAVAEANRLRGFYDAVVTMLADLDRDLVRALARVQDMVDEAGDLASRAVPAIAWSAGTAGASALAAGLRG